MSKKIKAGALFEIPVGCDVTRLGKTERRVHGVRFVHVRSVEKTATGEYVIAWKSNGCKATTVL